MSALLGDIHFFAFTPGLGGCLYFYAILFYCCHPRFFSSSFRLKLGNVCTFQCRQSERTPFHNTRLRDVTAALYFTSLQNLPKSQNLAHSYPAEVPSWITTEFQSRNFSDTFPRRFFFLGRLTDFPSVVRLSRKIYMPYASRNVFKRRMIRSLVVRPSDVVTMKTQSESL